MLRIALIHATPLSIEPINAAFAQLWPEAERMHLLDDSLSRDRQRDGELTPAMTQRFVTLATYAKGTGADAILFTCSAFGPAIDEAGRAVGIPTLKPNEAMFEQALGMGRRLALVATFAPSIDSMAPEIEQMARERKQAIDLQTVHVPGAMDDLAAGRADEHHRKIADAVAQLADRDAVMLAQFSMSGAQPAAQARTSCPILTSPACAVAALRRRMAGAA
ncbi:aspartate/glutamate racemase family protein [Ramlibacter sp. PS4R-6]|uniref:aspartate/glutamate racemase family protein n=1 Tax=Ramlibacter sp. PS4R-6 TaxID=3133438 RepID=UPI0030A78A1E